jgi:hypothetical protein
MPGHPSAIFLPNSSRFRFLALLPLQEHPVSTFFISQLQTPPRNYFSKPERSVSSTKDQGRQSIARLGIRIRRPICLSTSLYNSSEYRKCSPTWGRVYRCSSLVDPEWLRGGSVRQPPLAGLPYKCHDGCGTAG